MSLRPKRIDFQTIYEKLRGDLVTLYSSCEQKKINASISYNLVYTLCTATPLPYTVQLYNEIGKFITDEAIRIVTKIISSPDIVDCYAKEWLQFKAASGYTNRICEYLNKIMVKPDDGSSGGTTVFTVDSFKDLKFKRQTIEALAFEIWRRRVLKEIQGGIKVRRLTFSILELIRKHRDGEEVDLSTIAVAVKSYCESGALTEIPLALYKEEFEKPYLLHLREYYYEESEKYIQKVSVSEFMDKAYKRLEEEFIRSKVYCDISSMEKVVSDCENVYIATHKRNIEAEFERFIDENSSQDCKLSYKLLSRIENGVDEILVTLKKYVEGKGKKIIASLPSTAAKDPREYIECLTKLHQEYMTICSSNFNSDPRFIAAIDKAFGAIMNGGKQDIKSPNTLARYCDMMLKKNTKLNLSETEIEDKLNQSMVLFKYIEDRDIFQKFYSRMLAKRLINGMSASEEAETSMVARLKTACGLEYTHKLQRMFTDMTLSSDLSQKFREFNKTSPIVGPEFSIFVLTAGSWPLPTGNTAIQLPDELQKALGSFTTFYKECHSGRKLTWLWQLCKVDIRAFGFDRNYELNVSLHQFLILRLLEVNSGISVQDCISKSGLSMDDIVRSAKPLVEIALITISSEDISDTTVISISNSFSSKRTKIKVNSPFMTEQGNDTASAIEKSVQQDRLLFIQAAIVRIMKSQKRLQHNNLVKEVIEESKQRFTPDIPLIKKCIGQLLQKEYLGRSVSDKDVYEYMA